MRDTVGWSPQQYLKFEDQRTRPVHDLLAALPQIHAQRVVDLGCGPGNSTAVLRDRFMDAAVGGVDSSADMIAAARVRLPDVQFEVSDIDGWASRDTGRFGVVLANAVLQWLPAHERLLPALVARLAPGGALAVQMPDNLGEPAHAAMREIARGGPWSERLADVCTARAPLARAEWYYDVLRCAGCTVDVWHTTYHHALAGGAAAVVEWFMGSGLRPFLEPLDTEERREFLASYQRAIAAVYPEQTDGSVLLPFPRLFIVAIA